jgi:Flp pilus assembly protein TadG
MEICVSRPDMTDMPVSNERERGATLIMFTFLTAMVLLPMIGLAIDGSIYFWEKAKLSAAVDAAALASGRSFDTAIGQKYFAANFPTGNMGTSVVGGQPTITLDTSQLSVVTVTVQAQVTVPLYFLRILGIQNATLGGYGQSVRRDVNVILVLDRSGSMNAGTECGDLRNAASTFANLFLEGRDTLELITFQTTANIDYPHTTNFKTSPTIATKIGQLVCAGATNSSMALSVAHTEIQTINTPTKLNVVLFFTDGFPTAFYMGGANAFPIKTLTDTRYGVSNTGSQSSVGASPCNNGDVLAGVVTMPGQSPDATGTTYGISSPAPIAISSSAGGNPPLISASGCQFVQQNDWQYMRQDVAYIPARDFYLNITDSGYRPLVYFPASNAPYYTVGGVSGKTIRPDVPQSVLNVAFNTADEAAKSIRNDPTYNSIIFCIGLGASVDSEFMKRVANTADSTSYDNTKASGDYIYAPTSAQLTAAFQQVASEILHLSK